MPMRKTFMNFSLLNILPYLGTLPFVLGTFAKMSGTLPMIYFIDTRRIVLSYGVLIVSFMAGVHWGQYLSGTRGKLNLLITSNMIALVAWVGGLLMLPTHICYLLIVLFALLYVIDRGLEIPTAYLQTRRNVTLIVCACLLALSFA